MALRLTLLGTGTPTPLAHRAGQSFLVRWGDDALLFDCGPGTVRRLLEADVSPTRITHLFLTHLHYDHCVDYGYLVLNRWDQGAGQIPELAVCGPKGTAQMTALLFGEDSVWAPDLAARTQHPGSQFFYQQRGGVLPRQRPQPGVTEVADGDCVPGAGWQVTVAAMPHAQPHLESVAYRLETPDGTVVVTGDTAPTPRLITLAQKADVLLHMCHFVNDVETDPRLTASCSGHLDAARTARAASVKALVLVHLTEQVERPGVRERLLAEVAGEFGGTVIFGDDLLEVPLGPAQAEPLR